MLIKVKNFFKKLHFGPLGIIILSFFSVILIGGIILYLPFTHKEGVNINFLDALFTSTSCTCITGLVSIKNGLGDSFNLFGRVIITILIQLGGLGVTTFAVVIFMLTSRKLTYTKQSLIKESWNLNSYKNIKFVFAQVLLVNFFFEFIGAFIFFFLFHFRYNFPVNESFGYAIFHSISSYNNAGVDFFGINSLIPYKNDFALTFFSMMLGIFGGIGFTVIVDILAKKFKFKYFRLQTKVVLTYSLAFLIIGSLLIFLCEINSGSNTSFLGAVFMSSNSRSGGYTLYDLSKYRDITILIIMLLMFVGASPSGTGGGVKVTTIAVFFAYIRGIITGRDPHLFRRSISEKSAKKALLLILVGLLFFLLGFLLICLFEMDYNYIYEGAKYKDYIEGAADFNSLNYAFDAMSAFATVGLSTGVTPYFSEGSKIILIILMYVGRVGPLSISTVFSTKDTTTYKFVEEDMAIG